ncbi:MAG: YybH family protein [Planctomycetota bacterium]|jgi:ketosteroid isomerase-like protein
MKSVITKAGVVALVVVFLYGCQMGPTDQEQLTTALGQWKAALEAQDIDRMMEPYSEDYEGERGRGKEGVREFLSGLMDEGALDNIDMDISEAQIEIEGDKATVGPIIYSGGWGEIEMMRILKKEDDGVWRIVGAEEY